VDPVEVVVNFIRFLGKLEPTKTNLFNVIDTLVAVTHEKQAKENIPVEHPIPWDSHRRGQANHIYTPIRFILKSLSYSETDKLSLETFIQITDAFPKLLKKIETPILNYFLIRELAYSLGPITDSELDKLPKIIEDLNQFYSKSELRGILGATSISEINKKATNLHNAHFIKSPPQGG
jgi:hypothetical protein